MIWRKDTPPVPSDDRQRGFDDFELRLGDILRGERATLGKSLLDVQRELHIRASHIAAIENGDLAAFETQGFIAGFVRSYARYLGMDPEWVYERFCLEHNFQVAHGMASGASSTPRTVQSAPKDTARLAGGLRGVGMLPDPDPFWRRIEPGALGSVSVLVALIVGLGYAGWSVLQEVQRVQVAPADVVPTVVSDLNPLAGETRGIATDPLAAVPPALASIDTPLVAPGAAEGHVRLARPDPLDVPVLVPRDGPIASIIRDRATSPDVAAPATDAAVAAALSEPSVTPAPRVLASGPAQVEILAVRPSWMRLRAADGSIIFERILDAGERYAVPQTELPPSLHAGNSGSVYFLINGEAYGPASPGANVIRNISLDSDSLRDTYALADLTRDQDLAVQVARLRDQ